jgi:hypothetical protein
MSVLVYEALMLLKTWDFSVHDTPPAFSSTGPTSVQLERLQYLVSTRVQVADILVGESQWLQGSWIILGDALLAVDMKRARIQDKQSSRRTAVIVLPQPVVLSPRVNHERTQQWDIKSRSWIPLASMIIGDRTTMEKQAMLQAQQLVERAAKSHENMAMARQSAEAVMVELFGALGWQISVRWD